MSESKNLKKLKKGYRKTDEYLLANSRLRKSKAQLFFSLIAIFIPFLYFSAVVQFEHHFYPIWSLHIGFYIFILGIAGACAVIPLFFRILQCPFNFKKLFFGIVISTAFGFIGSLIVFRVMKLETDELLMAMIISAAEALVCTIFAVIGANRNLWVNVKNRSAKKEVVQAYRRYVSSVTSDPVDIIAIYALAQSDYSFAKNYMKDSNALNAFLGTARQNLATGKISVEEYREFIRYLANNGVREAEIDCATYYIRLSENDLIRMNLDNKTTAISLINRLHGYAEAENDFNIRSIWLILRAHLQSSMIISEDDPEKNLEKLLESSTSLKDIISNVPDDSEISTFAKTTLQDIEVAIHRSLLYNREKGRQN